MAHRGLQKDSLADGRQLAHGGRRFTVAGGEDRCLVRNRVALGVDRARPCHAVYESRVAKIRHIGGKFLPTPFMKWHDGKPMRTIQISSAGMQTSESGGDRDKFHVCHSLQQI